MHTFKTKSCTFHHNGDYSGPVSVTDIYGVEAKVDFDDLKAFVANYTREKLIAKLENAADDELLDPLEMTYNLAREILSSLPRSFLQQRGVEDFTVSEP